MINNFIKIVAESKWVRPRRLTDYWLTNWRLDRIITHSVISGNSYLPHFPLSFSFLRIFLPIFLPSFPQTHPYPSLRNWNSNMETDDGEDGVTPTFPFLPFIMVIIITIYFFSLFFAALPCKRNPCRKKNIEKKKRYYRWEKSEGRVFCAPLSNVQYKLLSNITL